MKQYFETLWTNPAAARKTLVALIGAVVMLATQGLLPAAVATYVLTVVPVLTALGVYAVHNAAPKAVDR